MADDAARSRLGRGLASLIGDVGAESQADERAPRSQRKVPIELVRANPRNPRKLFSDAELDELADSIRERGIIQPIVVRAARRRQLRDHRRRAALARGAARRPARGADRRARRQRRRSARACDHRERPAHRSQSAGRGDRLSVARQRIQSLAGRHRARSSARAAAISPTRCGCCNLPETVKAYINSGKLTAGHARMLVGQPNAEELARRDRRPGPERAPGRGDGAQERPRRRRARRKRTGRLGKDADTEALENAADRRARACSSPSTIAPTAAACCRCATARSSSSTTWSRRLERGPNLG